MFTGIFSAATTYSSFWLLTFAIYAFVFIGWIYAIGKITNTNNQKNRIENYKEDLWFVLFLVSFIPFGYFSHTTKPENGFLMFGTLIFEAVSAIKLINFSARAISQYEKKKNLKFNDYVSEFIMILFSPIGIWIIQPKMNRIAKEI